MRNLLTLGMGLLSGIALALAVWFGYLAITEAQTQSAGPPERPSQGEPGPTSLSSRGAGRDRAAGAPARLPASQDRVAIRARPRAAEVAVGQVVAVDLWLENPGRVPVDGVQLHLRYDPAVLHLADSAGRQATALDSAALDPSWRAVILNLADGEIGRLDLALGTSLGGPPLTGPKLPVATLHFRAQAPSPETSLAFLQTGKLQTIVASGGISVLGSIEEASLRVVAQA